MRVLIALAAAAALAVLGGIAFVWSGLYDISANRQHTQLVYTVLEQTMHQSVRLRARAIDVPPLADDALVARGGACFKQKCVQCHGGPGQAQAEIGRSMQPLPGPLVDATRHWRPAELYWITRNGIKMSGMPAWQHHLSDADIWAVVAFMQRLPTHTSASFREVEPGSCSAASEMQRPPDIARGRQATTQYACNACHLIPGVTGSSVSVGPPLAGFANRQTIAGSVPNDTAQLVRWLRRPQDIDPQTTMPDMQVSEQDALDMAAFLQTLR